MKSRVLYFLSILSFISLVCNSTLGQEPTIEHGYLLFDSPNPTLLEIRDDFSRSYTGLNAGTTIERLVKASDYYVAEWEHQWYIMDFDFGIGEYKQWPATITITANHVPTKSVTGISDDYIELIIVVDYTKTEFALDAWDEVTVLLMDEDVWPDSDDEIGNPTKLDNPVLSSSSPWGPQKATYTLEGFLDLAHYADYFDGTELKFTVLFNDDEDSEFETEFLSIEEVSTHDGTLGLGAYSSSIDTIEFIWGSVSGTSAIEQAIGKTEVAYLHVLPSQKDAPYSGISDTVQLNSNIPWTTSSDSDWLIVTGQTTSNGKLLITYSVSSNNSTYPREGSIRIWGTGSYSNYYDVFTVNQEGKPYIAITPTTNRLDEIIHPSEQISVDSNTSWSASTSNSWIKILSGSSGNESGNVIYEVNFNPHSQDRKGYIYLEGPNVSQKTHTIYQKGNEKLTVEYASKGFTSAGGIDSLDVTSNRSWTAISDSNWTTITTGNSGSSGSSTISYNVASNSGSERSGKIIVETESGRLDREVVVTQSAYTEPYTNISPESMTVPVAGGSYDVQVSSDQIWSVTNLVNWIKVDKTSGANAGVIGVTVDPHESLSSREHSFTIGGKPHKVIQEGSVGETDKNGNWIYSEWFGWFYDMGEDWIYHINHGYTTIVHNHAGGINLYDSKLDCWFWFSEEYYPNVYKFGENEGWYYFETDTLSGDRVFARLANEEVIEEENLNYTPIDPDKIVPKGPTNLTVTVISSTEVELNWKDNSNNEDGWVIESTQIDVGPWDLYTELNTPDLTRVTISDLTPGMDYYFRLYAYNNAGSSSISTAQNPVTLPDASFDSNWDILISDNFGDGVFDLSIWDNPSTHSSLQLKEENGHLNFIGNGGGHIDLIKELPAYGDDFQIVLDVRNTYQYEEGESSDCRLTIYDEDYEKRIYIALLKKHTGTFIRFWGSNFDHGTNVKIHSNFVSLKLEYNGTDHSFQIYYDPDGRYAGAGWQYFSTWNISNLFSDWQMRDDELFIIAPQFDNHLLEVKPGEYYFDNFEYKKRYGTQTEEIGSELWVTGRNNRGQLGIGTTSITMNPVLVESNIRSVYSSNRNTLFLDGNNTLWGMGMNDQGQLGLGHKSTVFYPESIDSNVENVVRSKSGTSYYIKTDGSLWGMGANYSGQLGDSNTADRITPTFIDDNVILAETEYSTTLYIKSDGSLWGLGRNSHNIFGSDKGYSISSPMQIDSNVIDVSIEGYTIYFLKGDGTLWGVGDNRYGQLGLGDIETRELPTLIDNEVTQFSAANDNCLFVKVDKSLFGMGRNRLGNLGVGDTEIKSSPVIIDTNVSQVSCEFGHSLYIKLDKSLWGMGRTSYLRRDLNPDDLQLLPIQLDNDVIYSLASSYNSLYIKSDYTFWGLGHNIDGIFGIGSRNSPIEPQLISADISSFSISPYHDTSLFFITKNGQLWGVGNNEYGQLGIETGRNRNTYLKIGSGVLSAAAGRYHSLYVDKSGDLWAFGSNSFGSLGDGTNIDQYDPVYIMSDVSSVSCGVHHAMILKHDGTLLGMGFNEYGQLGDGSTNFQSTPVTIESDVKMISAGEVHSLFIKNNGTLWGMGWNYFGQLGIEGIDFVSSPIHIASDVQNVKAGGRHSLFLADDDSLWGMGSNSIGQLGNPITEDIKKPTKIAESVRSISAGTNHSLFIGASGKLWGMGQNFSGEIIDSGESRIFEPTLVSDHVKKAYAGNRYSLFIDRDNSLFGMGSNFHGQLGAGSLSPVRKPIKLMHDVVDVATGGYHSLILQDQSAFEKLFDNGGPAGKYERTGNDIFEQRLYDDFSLSSNSIIRTIIWQQHDRNSTPYQGTRVTIYDGLPEDSNVVFEEDFWVNRTTNRTGTVYDVFDGYNYRLENLSIELPAGTYWLGLNSIIHDSGWDLSVGGPDTIEGSRLINVNFPAPGKISPDRAFVIYGEEVQP